MLLAEPHGKPWGFVIASSRTTYRFFLASEKRALISLLGLESLCIFFYFKFPCENFMWIGRCSSEAYRFESLYQKKTPPMLVVSFLAQTVGFEPTCRFTDKLISSQPRYDHFDTSAYFIRTLQL